MTKRLNPKKTTKGRKKIDVEELILKIYYELPRALNDSQLCSALGVSEAFFYDTKARNPDFLDAIKHYKRVSPIEVLQSFKKVAVGFSYDETTREPQKDKKTGKIKMVATKVVTKYVTPNASAGYNYLKNQMPEEFKDKVETVHSLGAGMEMIEFKAKRRE
ncbi:MAG: helix-turn-helix domain-containing protein [Bacteroidota bacterium]|nr:helix-turn-helix domain-containing protein [Bacteroidota bacterium]